ncbi:MAG TPA: hypothetical protein PLE74_07165 [Candidatus Cloacimonadota bacterium]|nr:hypothetical protein [Candidatus Cloacimonadota bacterium]
MAYSDIFRYEREIKQELVRAIYDNINFDESEPRIVAKLISLLTGTINGQIVQGLFSESGLKISSGGVFTHQQPQVKSPEFPQNGAVEIGDLLLVMNFERRNGTIDRTAVLYQVKKLEHPDNNDNQRYLYNNWPEFDYFRSSPRLNMKRRHITGPHLYLGAKYLYIGEITNGTPISRALIFRYFIFHHCNNKPCDNSLINKIHNNQLFICYPPYDPYNESFYGIHTVNCFIDELFHFITGNGGRHFDYQPCHSNTNWDQVITDLIDITSQNVTSYYARQPRQQGVFNFMGNWESSNLIGKVIPSQVIDSFQYNNEPVFRENQNNDNILDETGASVIEINIKEN